jgi:hypothetical protein
MVGVRTDGGTPGWAVGGSGSAPPAFPAARASVGMVGAR